MKKINVNELSGEALNYALYYYLMPMQAKDDVMPNGIPYWVKVQLGSDTLPTEDWGSCGELIEREGVTVGLNINPEAPKWMAIGYDGPIKMYGLADDPKVAVVRAVVASHFGYSVEIPDEVKNG